MSTKKILLLTITIITTPLILIIQSSLTGVDNTDKLNKIVTNLYQCYDLPPAERDNCYLLNLKTKLSLVDNLSLLKKIDNDINDNRKIKNLCHDITHIIGTSAYKNHEEKSLIAGYDSCGQGYYHGIMSEILLKKDNGVERLTKFCASTSNTLKEIGVCYHGIGHSIVNLITTKNDKEFIATLSASCLTLKANKNIKETSTYLYNKKSYASDAQIKELVVNSCFNGGFGEYMDKKIKSSYIPGQLNNNDCENIDIILLKECHFIIFQYIILEQIVDTSLTIDQIYQPFAQKCTLLNTDNKIEIKIKEGCFKAIPRSYINATLMGNLKYKDRDLPNLLELNINELYTLIKKICAVDYNNSCSIWFLNDIQEKLIPSDHILLLSKFDNITPETLRNTN